MKRKFDNHPILWQILDLISEGMNCKFASWYKCILPFVMSALTRSTGNVDSSCHCSKPPDNLYPVLATVPGWQNNSIPGGVRGFHNSHTVLGPGLYQSVDHIATVVKYFSFGLRKPQTILHRKFPDLHSSFVSYSCTLRHNLGIYSFLYRCARRIIGVSIYGF